jgi:hypothetical protein
MAANYTGWRARSGRGGLQANSCSNHDKGDEKGLKRKKVIVIDERDGVPGIADPDPEVIKHVSGGFRGFLRQRTPRQTHA